MKKFNAFEAKWQKVWSESNAYRAIKDPGQPKFYCLDMFPYPSGAGLHVGHPRGYIASDILSRYKMMCGYNVLHPMGFDAFGLPAEQYAIDTGRHPRETTDFNIKRFKEQLSIIGLGYDSERELRTCDPAYYHWTQWIFLKLFDSWYDEEQAKARPIHALIQHLSKHGTHNLLATRGNERLQISAEEWNTASHETQSRILMNFRLAYRAEASVNWCPALGTVLANDEIKDGLSERGGHAVEKKKMQQWMLRISAYADRLLNNLDALDWPSSIKEMQRNWIGKSNGGEITFALQSNANVAIHIFSSRPETVYGCTFLVLAPEHPMVKAIAKEDCMAAVNSYINLTSLKSERDRLEDVTSISGVFTGMYAINPVTNLPVPIWISDYVLPDYGTGAIMAVPASDERDYRFATQFKLPIKHVIAESIEQYPPYTVKTGTLINSEQLDGLTCELGRIKIMEILASTGKGKLKTNFRMRDAIFGRQRYWGEPIPIYYDSNGIPCAVNEADLPITLPEIDKYLPTEAGEPPLARAEGWEYRGYELEKTTMPGWAGSSWYFIRYMDSKNNNSFCDVNSFRYWQSVDCYVGGSEHSTGHLLYSRFWTQFLFDLDYINFEEPFHKIICQGMILGRSALIYRDIHSGNIISSEIRSRYETQPLHISLECLSSEFEVDIDALKAWRNEFNQSAFILNSDKILRCDRIVEKMSKSKHNVVTPDDIIEQYGADCFRIHEMFLGPIDQPCPWSTETIEGASKFIKRVSRLFEKYPMDDQKPSKVSPELEKLINKTILKIRQDIESMSYNTAIAALMSLVGLMQKDKSVNRESLTTLLKLLHPFAPHLTQELWTSHLEMDGLLTDFSFPDYDPLLVVDNFITYPISINGKVRATLDLASDIDMEGAKECALSISSISEKIGQNPIKRFVFVKDKMINFVI